MIDFMIIGLPRSATTWAANWLTAGDVFCAHDPLHKVHYSEWDTDRVHFPHPMLYNTVGVSCTGIWRWPEFVNSHSARKIVVTRDMDDIQDELTTLGFPRLEDNAEFELQKINAQTIPHTDLFDTAKAADIWEYLTGSEVGFCPLRHAALVEMQIQPMFSNLEKDPILTEKLQNEI